jgi:N-acyl-D-amino-acid deacylase
MNGVEHLLDIVIKNALIVDGSGGTPYKATVAIDAGHIAAIDRSCQMEAVAKKTIAGDGLVLSPGFIDMHSHSDLMLMADPDSPLKIFQGVTTETLGQDGIGVAPSKKSDFPGWSKFMAGVAGAPLSSWPWESISEYLDALRSVRPAVNVLTLVPFGNVRKQVIGLSSRTPSAAEIGEMQSILRAGIDDGAFGMSVGLIYVPNCYASKEELIELYKTISPDGGLMFIHMRNEGDFLLESMDEALEIARTSGVPLHISHFKAAGRDNWGKFPAALDKVANANATGHQVTYDQYPYTAASTMLMALLPTWALEGGVNETISRLSQPAIRERIKHEFVHDMADRAFQLRMGWDNYVKYAGWDGILVTAVKNDRNKSLEGKTISQIASEWNKAPDDAALDLLIDEECSPGMAVFFLNEENVIKGMKAPFQTVGTDGLLGGKPHPRAGGSYPRILGRYVRELKALTLQEAVRKMTGAPADTLGLGARGYVREGYAADLVLFDPTAVIDRNTFTDPRERPAGIPHVIVNGVLTVENGELTGKRAGRVLTRKNA